jgi:hypothetical protein
MLLHCVFLTSYFDWHARGNVTATWTNATSKAQKVTITLHSVPCAVITDPEVALRHNNLRTIDKVSSKFRKRGFMVHNTDLDTHNAMDAPTNPATVKHARTRAHEHIPKCPWLPLIIDAVETQYTASVV